MVLQSLSLQLVQKFETLVVDSFVEVNFGQFVDTQLGSIDFFVVLVVAGSAIQVLKNFSCVVLSESLSFLDSLLPGDCEFLNGTNVYFI